MIRTFITVVVIALFVLQNFVYCCGHVHASDRESDQCRPHFHFHDHHGHDHCDHHHHEDGSKHDQRSGHEDPHDCFITTLKQDAIIPDSNAWLSDLDFDFYTIVATVSRLHEPSQRPATNLIRLSKHLYWYQTGAIYLQLCALLN